MSNATRTNIVATPNDDRQGIEMVEPVFLSRDTLAEASGNQHTGAQKRPDRNSPSRAEIHRDILDSIVGARGGGHEWHSAVRYFPAAGDDGVALTPVDNTPS